MSEVTWYTDFWNACNPKTLTLNPHSGLQILGNAVPGGFGSRVSGLLSSLLLSSLELSDTKVYGPEIRALLGTASHLCEAVVLKLTPLFRSLESDFA